MAQLNLTAHGRNKYGIFAQNPHALAGRRILGEPPSYVLQQKYTQHFSTEENSEKA